MLPLTTPMLTPTLTRARVPATQPLTSVRVHASVDTHSRESSVDILRMRWLVYRSPAPLARSTMPNDGLIEPMQGQTAQRWLEHYGGTTPSNFAEPSQVGSTMATTNIPCRRQWPVRTRSMNTDTTMRPSNEARTGANDAHQCTNDMLA